MPSQLTKIVLRQASLDLEVARVWKLTYSIKAAKCVGGSAWVVKYY